MILINEFGFGCVKLQIVSTYGSKEGNKCCGESLLVSKNSR
jgi:hypothetical protein